MKRLLVPLSGFVALFGLVACSKESSDFQSNAEDLIEDDDDAVANETGYTFEDAECEEPENTDEGTTYTCTAVDNEGDTWDFTMEITGDRAYSALAYHAKYLTEKILLPNLQSIGTVDEACVDAQVATLSEENIKSMIDDALDADEGATTQAIFDGIATACVS
jgi:hypothetical protein